MKNHQTNIKSSTDKINILPPKSVDNAYPDGYA